MNDPNQKPAKVGPNERFLHFLDPQTKDQSILVIDGQAAGYVFYGKNKEGKYMKSKPATIQIYLELLRTCYDHILDLQRKPRLLDALGHPLPPTNGEPHAPETTN